MLSRIIVRTFCSQVGSTCRNGHTRQSFASWSHQPALSPMSGCCACRTIAAANASFPGPRRTIRVGCALSLHDGALKL
jgi:hypothetical protein